jgi:hypothetical protein
MDRPNRPEMHFSHYFPGPRYVDVLSLDVYGADFHPAYYDSLVALSGGRPLALAEVGNPPTPEILSAQPKWTFYVIWAGMVRNTPRRRHRALAADPRVLSLEDAAYREVTAPFRAACGLAPLAAGPAVPSRPDFSGRWSLNEDRCAPDNAGIASLPARLRIRQARNRLEIQRTVVLEYADDRVTEETLPLDGTEVRSEFRDSPRFTKARWSGKGDTLIVDSRVVFEREGQASEMKTREFWTLGERGGILSIRQVSDSSRGRRDITMVFEKE